MHRQLRNRGSVAPTANEPFLFFNDLRQTNNLGVHALIFLLILALIGGLPSWPYSASWGYFPSSGIGLVLLVVIIIAVVRR